MGIVGAPKVKYDEVDAKARLLGLVGDVDEYKPLNNKVLVAVYMRPDKTKGGIIIDTKEDEWQSKIGLIIACGGAAFDNTDGKWFQGTQPKLHDWISFKGSSGTHMQINGHPCRIFTDLQFDMVVPAPDSIW